MTPVNARSMTGFGAAASTGEHGSIRVEARSVNHRFLDVQLNLPSFLAAHEADLRGLVSERIKRARVDVWVTWESPGDVRTRVVVDRDLLGQLYRDLEAAREALGIAGSVDIALLGRLPDVVRLEHASATVDDARFAALCACLTEALGQLDEARCQEGAALVGDITERFATLEELVERAARSSAVEPERIAERLRERIGALLGDGKLDPVRLHQEIAFAAERADVSEELTRLRVHLERARELLAAGGQLGKPLDFLVQELGREINTLGAKSRAPETSGHVLAMKAELEKIREQARNLE